MAITTAMCTSFKQELLGGVHDLDTHTLKLALIKLTIQMLQVILTKLVVLTILQVDKT